MANTAEWTIATRGQRLKRELKDLKALIERDLLMESKVEEM
jgi:hypothetical protein